MFVVLFLHRAGADICSKGAEVIDNLDLSFFKIPSVKFVISNQALTHLKIKMPKYHTKDPVWNYCEPCPGKDGYVSCNLCKGGHFGGRHEAYFLPCFLC